MSYQKNLNEQNDIVRETDQSVSSGIWSEGASTLSSFFTSSVQSGSNGAYYMQIFNKDVSDASSAKQFSILYGHKGGSGSLGKPGVTGNRETATVYGQMLNLTQPPETELFTFDSTNAATQQHIFALSFDRARMREKVDPGNWEIKLGNSGSGAGHFVRLIDDSSTNSSYVNSAGVTEYNVVSGSIQGGSTTIAFSAADMDDATGSYGKFYPDLGLVILNAHALSLSQLGSTGGDAENNANTAGVSGPLLSLNTGSNELLPVGSSSVSRLYAAFEFTGSFQARREEAVSSTHYFCRVGNSEFNSSTNPTYVSSSGDIKIESFKNDPKTYITTVALYGEDTAEPLAIAKLSQPILKSRSREALIKVKLDF
jgi:hypothetical protein|tara:strand:- start:868 stop:1974 length:1107 start_codon:yes stop_codon:yes gene_type:complete